MLLARMRKIFLQQYRPEADSACGCEHEADHLQRASGSATSRAQSIKSCAAGLSVRFFKARIPIAAQLRRRGNGLADLDKETTRGRCVYRKPAPY
jgi:hypothetical protein